MVRYPQKNSFETAKQPSESTTPKIIDEIKIEKKFESKARPKHNKVIFYTGLFFGILILAGFFLINHLYVSTFTIELNPKEFSWPGQWGNTSSDSFAGFEKYPPFMVDMKYLNLKEINVAENGKLISVRVYAFGLENSRQIAENWESSFVQKYALYRKNVLMDFIDARHKEFVQMEDQTTEVLDQMSNFKPDERYFLVNESSKEKLIQLTQQNEPELERNLQYIKNQLADQLNSKPLNHWSQENRAMLETYRLRLTDMEFKKFLIGPDFLNSYEEGMRTTKAAVVQLINDQASLENEDELSASLIIRNFMLNCRQEALEVVLNKRYVISIDELPGRMAQYIKLKVKFEDLSSRLNKFSLINRQVKEALEKGFIQEVSLKSSLKVFKY